MTLSKRAVLNPKQQSKHSKTGQKASNVLTCFTWAGLLPGRVIWWWLGETVGGGAESEQDEIDRVQITTIQ